VSREGWRAWSKAAAERLRATGVEPLVIVRRDAGHGEMASYRIEDIETPYVGARRVLYSTVSCEGAVDGAVLHHGTYRDPCPHWIRVRILLGETHRRVREEIRVFMEGTLADREAVQAKHTTP
jgi:hypothetical protein